MNHSHEKVAFWKKHHNPTTNSSHSTNDTEKHHHHHKEKHKTNNNPNCCNSNSEVAHNRNDRDYRDAFNSVDANFDGRITMIELKEAFEKLGHTVTDEDVQKMIQGADLDNNGTVEYEEFVELMKRFRSTKPKKVKSTDTEAYEVFKGTMKDYEWKMHDLMAYRSKCVATSGQSHCDHQFTVIKAFDHNGDDLLDFNEIKSTMIALGERVTDDEVRAMIIEADLDRNGKIDFSEFKRIMEMFQKKSAN